MIFSAQMYSQDGEAFPNILNIHWDTATPFVYVEVEAKHDGVKVCSVVKVERAVLAHHIRQSGILP